MVFFRVHGKIGLCSREAYAGGKMGTVAKKIDPEDYILAALPAKERLDAALKIAGEVFKKTSLRLHDVEAAVKKVRRKAYAKKK